VVAFQYGGVISFSLDTSFCILEWTVGGGVVGAAFACRWLKLQSTIILGNHEGVAALLFEACSLRCLEDVKRMLLLSTHPCTFLYLPAHVLVVSYDAQPHM
jgi:hypothetical protein